MSKIMPLGLSLSILSILSLVNLLIAEDYISKDVPPDELIVGAIQNRMQKEGAKTKFDRVLGKRRNGEESCTYYYRIFIGNNPMVTGAEIQKLDTNIWILTLPGQLSPIVLQK